jgi:hypothetical protein
LAGSRRGHTVEEVRALLAALSLSAAYPGAWATFAPRSFFTTFPGAGHHWTALLPGFSSHLIADVGAFYLAFALLFAWAAARPSRELIVPISTAFALFSAIHLAWHTAHLDGFSTTDAVAQTASLAAVLVGSLGAAALAIRRPPARAAS